MNKTFEVVSMGIRLSALVRRLEKDGVKFGGNALEYGLRERLLECEEETPLKDTRFRFVGIRGRELLEVSRTVPDMFEAGVQRGYLNPSLYAALLLRLVYTQRELVGQTGLATVFHGPIEFQGVSQILVFKATGGDDWLTARRSDCRTRLGPDQLCLFLESEKR